METTSGEQKASMLMGGTLQNDDAWRRGTHGGARWRPTMRPGVNEQAVSGWIQGHALAAERRAQGYQSPQVSCRTEVISKESEHAPLRPDQKRSSKSQPAHKTIRLLVSNRRTDRHMLNYPYPNQVKPCVLQSQDSRRKREERAKWSKIAGRARNSVTSGAGTRLCPL
jgi:hypothetical protein